MTAKFNKFVTELRALCIAHGVTLTASQYDNLQVWDFDGHALDTVVEDKTNAQEHDPTTLDYCDG